MNKMRYKILLILILYALSFATAVAFASPKKSCRMLSYFEAIKKQRTECISIITQTMNIEEWDHQGNRALHHAVLKNDLKLVMKLIKLGSDPMAKNQNARRPLDLAQEQGYREIVDYLDRVEVETARFLRAVEDGHVKHALGSITRGIAIGHRDNNYNTPLHTASRFGSIEIILQLILEGADKDAKNTIGNSPLHQAILSKNYMVAQGLIQQDVNLNAMNARRESALDLAEGTGAQLIAKKLIAKQAQSGRSQYTRLSLTIIDSGNSQAN